MKYKREVVRKKEIFKLGSFYQELKYGVLLFMKKKLLLCKPPFCGLPLSCSPDTYK